MVFRALDNKGETSDMKSRPDYYGYLQSKAWKEFRETVFDVEDHCVDCFMSRADHLKNYGRDMECHHETYVNLGREMPLVDVVPLCLDCHNKRHGLSYAAGGC